MGALQKADPTLVTEVDVAFLKGAEQVAQAMLPQPAKPPPDSFLTDEQFQSLREASMSAEDCWDESSAGQCPEDLRSAFGNTMNFFSLLRRPSTDPTPVAWEAVRARWPILQGVPDDELQKNLVEIRTEFVDARF